MTYAARRLLATTVLSLPAPVVARLAGRPIQRDGNTLDPQVQLMLALARMAKVKGTHELSLSAARREMEMSGRILAPEPPPPADVREVTVAGAAGELRARVYRPIGVAAPAPCL